MAHEYKIVDPTIEQTVEEKIQDMYVQIEAYETLHAKLNAIEDKSIDQVAEIAAIETQLTRLISDYETLGGTFD